MFDESYDNDSRAGTDQISLARDIRDQFPDIRKTTKCKKCNGSIIIDGLSYINKNIYLKITCPCSVVENFDIKTFEDNYIVQERIEINNRKIATSDLFCACDNKSKNSYYCVDSQKNLCNRCIGNERDHINHTIIDFKDDKIEKIISDAKGIKFEENGTEENDDENISKENKGENISATNGNNDNELEVKKEKFKNDGDKFDNFKNVVDLIKKLVEQYEKNPYYNLYKSINNIYDFCLKMDKSTKVDNEPSIITKKRIRYKREFKEFKELKSSEKIISINIIKNNFYDLEILRNLSAENLEALEILRLQENNIDDIKVLSDIKFPNLKELNLSKNRLNDNCIKHLKNFKNKESITILNVYDNNIKNPEFFTIIKDFTNLKELYVGHNKFENKFSAEKYDFPGTLEIIGLTIGVFSNESINEIKKFNFKNLKTLYLKGNDLKNLDFIKNLTCENLENIWLRNNFIVDYKPLERFNKTLKRIILRGNLISDIKGLKNFVEQFEQLNELVLSENKIDLNNNENSKIIDQIIKLKKKNFILKYN